MLDINAEDIHQFWFQEIKREYWWEKNGEFDDQLRSRFGNLLEAAKRCELHQWRDTAIGRLAEIIVLDQFSRNIFRDTAEAFAADPLALALTQEAIREGADEALSADQRAFLYMPMMHSESPHIHAIAEQQFDQQGMESYLDFERKHKVIIDRFGRYPHRNALLGRTSTQEEESFLQQPGSSF